MSKSKTLKAILLRLNHLPGMSDVYRGTVASMVFHQPYLQLQDWHVFVSYEATHQNLVLSTRYYEYTEYY